jgi:transcriptional regulator with XRE-family HTH domain
MDTPLARALRKRRDDLGLKQHHVAKLCGVDISTISYWERGEFGPSDDKVDKVASFLDWSVERLLAALHKAKKAKASRRAA